MGIGSGLAWNQEPPKRLAPGGSLLVATVFLPILPKAWAAAHIGVAVVFGVTGVALYGGLVTDLAEAVRGGIGLAVAAI
jgi:hypothetical protein